jgi:hypothetical protein
MEFTGEILYCWLSELTQAKEPDLERARGRRTTTFFSRTVWWRGPNAGHCHKVPPSDTSPLLEKMSKLPFIFVSHTKNPKPPVAAPGWLILGHILGPDHQEKHEEWPHYHGAHSVICSLVLSPAENSPQTGSRSENGPPISPSHRWNGHFIIK